LAGSSATGKYCCESNTQLSATAAIGIAAIAILSCCSGGCATQLQRGQTALAKGNYDQAIEHFNAAKKKDPKAAALGLCVAAFDDQDVRLRGYCLEAIEQGNRLPDEIDENLCRREVGEDAVQYLSTSPFCQNTTPEVRSMISASLRQKLGAEIDGAIARSDFSGADTKLEIYQQIPDASSKLIRNWQQQITQGKASAASERKELEALQKERDAIADGVICENLPPYIAAAMNTPDFYNRLAAGVPETVNIRATHITALGYMLDDVPALLRMATALEEAENVSRSIALDTLSRRLSWIGRMTYRGSSDFNLMRWCDDLANDRPDQR